MAPTELLAVRRLLLPEQDEALQARMLLADQAWRDFGIQWFKPGTLGCVLFDKVAYNNALQMPGGKLWTQDPGVVADRLRSAMPEMPTSSDAIDVRVANIDFQGNTRRLRIVYCLEASELMTENRWLRDYFNAVNCRDTPHEVFRPVMAVASIPRKYAGEDILDAVWEIAQPSFTLQPPEPIVGPGW